jgi:outer membrane protein TolC
MVMTSKSVRVSRLPGVLLLGLILSWPAAAARSQTAAEPAPIFTRSEPLGPTITARPGSDEVLDLNACVAEALRTNDALTAERLRRRELEGKMKQALATGLPTLDLVGDWTRSRDPSFALDSTFGNLDSGMGDLGFAFPGPGEIPAQTFLRTNLNLSWTINPVQILGAVGAARLGIDQQELAITSVEQSTAETTTAAYHRIIRAAEKIQAVRAELANQNELLDIMKMRYELGLATRLDTLQAAVTLANIRPQLSIAQADLRNEGSRLNALMGRRPEDPIGIANSQVVERDPIVEQTALELAQMRPDIVATALFVDILRKNRQAQVSESRPYLTVNGAYGYVGKTFDSVFDDGHDAWRASVALNVPLFDGLRTKGLVIETDGRIRRTEAELTGRRRDVQVEVLEILANLRMARQVLAAVLLNLERSEEVLDESLLMLQLGKINYLDVLVSESNRAQARSNVIDARYEVLRLTAALKRALGYSPLVALADIPGLVPEVNR